MEVSTEKLILQKLDKLDQGFSSLCHRLDSLDHKFNTLNCSFDSLGQNFDSLSQRFDSLDQKFTVLNSGFNSLSQDFISLDSKVDSLRFEFSFRFERVEDRLDRVEISNEKLYEAFQATSDFVKDHERRMKGLEEVR